MNWHNDLVEVITKEVLKRVAEAPVERKLLTTQEAANYLSCDEKQIRNLVAWGKLKQVRIDGRPRYDRFDLDMLIYSHKT